MNKFELKETLENGVVTVVFEKVDGTLREMKCTLLTEYLPKTDSPTLLTERKEPDNVLSVWDIENNGWRSFRIDNIKEIRN
jgi:hypothetical protein